MIKSVCAVNSIQTQQKIDKFPLTPLFKMFIEKISFFIRTVQEGGNTKEVYTDLRREASQLGLSIQQYILVLQMLRAMQVKQSKF